MLGCSIDALADMLGSRTRALRARRWLYACRPLPFALPAHIDDIKRDAWQRLRDVVRLPEWRLTQRFEAADGTLRYVLDLAGATAETVLIPADSRSTVCVSSQSGCTRHCVFCATAKLGFGRQLRSEEIVLQYVLAQADAPAKAPARNVVFMGMGEPMDNLDEVLPAIDRLLEHPAPALGAGHVTVSTAGVLPGLVRFLREGRGQIALSLNATTDVQRDELMPHNRQWPIGDLLDALREDNRRQSQRRYFIEYVLWDGRNDTPEDAARLVALLAGLPAHVNLIPHNAHPGSPLQPSPPAVVEQFRAALLEAGLRCLVRRPRGREIAAACGQLAARV